MLKFLILETFPDVVSEHTFAPFQAFAAEDGIFLLKGLLSTNYVQMILKCNHPADRTNSCESQT